MKLLIIILFTSFTYELFSDNTYPYSYYVKNIYSGGNLIVTVDNNKIFNWFIKPFFTEDNEVIYSFNGFDNSIMEGSSLGGMNVISATNINTNLLSVWKDYSRVFLSYLDTNKNTIGINELFGNWNYFNQFDAKWIKSSNSNKILMLLNNSLFKVNLENNKLSSYFLYSNIIDAAYKNSNDTSNYSFLVNKDGNGIVYFINNDYAEKIVSRITLDEQNFLTYIDDYAIVISSSKTSNSSIIQIINKFSGKITDFRVDTYGERIRIIKENNTINLILLKSLKNGYLLEISDIQNFQKIENKRSVEIPFGFIEPIGIWVKNNTIYTLYRNGLITLDFDATILSSDLFQFGEYFYEHPTMSLFDDNIIFSSKNASIRLIKEEHTFWFLNKFIINFGRILLPLTLLVAFVITYSYYSKQKRFLNSLMNLPSSGIVLILDHYGKLLKINVAAKLLFNINEKVPLKKHYQYYFVSDFSKSFIELFEKAYSTKDGFSQKVIIRKDDVDKEFFVYFNPLLGVFGNFKGWLVTGIDITEELERKRLSNWAQLAHDMQTNLSTIKLNADLIEVDPQGFNLDRKKRILFQVNLLIQRVRDIVTVGRNDALARQVYDAFDICHEARAEFDDTVFPHITFVVNANHESVLCDNRKIVRALRNAIENGIKALKGKPGTITISNSSAGGIVFFKVKDSGPGMDEDTKSKILIPYFTTAAKHGGSGIGTMIMQHVMELHNGTITINSEVGKGTEVVFSFPNELITKKGKR